MIYYYLFIALTFIVASDFNGFVSVILGREGVLSSLILMLVLVLFFKSFSLKSKLIIGSKYLLLFFLYWLVVGSAIYFFRNEKYGDPLERVRYYLPSILMTYTLSIWFFYYIKIGLFDQIVNLFTVSLLFNCLVIIYSSIYGGIGSDLEDTEVIARSSGFIASVNQAGVTASIAQIFLLFRLLSVRERETNVVIIVIGYLIAVYAGISTFSKAAIINIVIILFLFVFYLLRNKAYSARIRTFLKIKRTKIISIFGALIVLVSIYAGVAYNKLNRFQAKRIDEIGALIRGEINEETTTGRSDLASYALNRIQTDGFLGRGLGTFNSMEGRGLGPHNQFLLIIGEIGILGGIIFFIYFLINAFSVIKSDENGLRFMGLSILAVLFITSMVSHTILFIKLYIIIFSFLNVIAYYSSKKTHLVNQF